jgi:parafibromin
MKDKSEQDSCLVGCASHTSEGLPQSESLDPESFSYFLVRRNFSDQDNDAESTSRQVSNAQDKQHSPSHRRHHSRGYSSAKSPKSPNTRKSGDSQNGKKKEGGSMDSSQSASSRYKNITDWNAGVSFTTPSSFGHSQRNLVDPPRAPKSGYEWVWFPEGYWAEREIRGFMPTPSVTKHNWWNRSSGQKSQMSRKSQKSQSTRKSTNGGKDENNDKAPPSFNLPQIKIGSVSLKSTIKTSRSTSQHTSENDIRRSGNFLGFNFSKPGQEDDRSAQQREGLYDRTKRTIEARFRKRVRAWSI